MHSNANWHTAGSSWKQIVPKVHLLTLHLFIKLVKSNIQNASTLLLMTGKQGQTSMGEGNQTFVLEFTLLGLSQDPKIQILLFCVFLIIYLLSVFGNLLIIILIQTDPRLHTPMYFFLKNLSFVDLCFSTSIVPQMLAHFLVKKKTISFAGCSLQIVVFLLAGCTECALLAMMSYDRYVAVCRPLHYSTLMTQRVCVSWPWFPGSVGYLCVPWTVHLHSVSPTRDRT